MYEVKTYVVIPTKFESNDTLFPLLENLQDDPSITRVYLLNNSDTDWFHIQGKYKKILILEFPDYNIYEMWNSMWRYIMSQSRNKRVNIAFLNDDIEIQPRTIQELSLSMTDSIGAVFPDVTADWDNKDWVCGGLKDTTTTAGDGGMTGYCFMVRGELDLRIDPNFKLYWGDDDLVKQIVERGYRISCLVGLPIKHRGSVTTRKMNPDIWRNIMEGDRQYFNKKYRENRGPVYI